MIHSLKAGLAAVALSLSPAAAALAGDLLFTAQEAAIIKAYYASRAADGPHADRGSEGAPPGAAATDAGARNAQPRAPGGNDRGRGRGHKHGRGPGSLPPGIAKNLARGKPLPPGIAMQALPPDLSERLPPPPPGCERVIVDGKVLLVDLATRVVHDILADVVYR